MLGIYGDSFQDIFYHRDTEISEVRETRQVFCFQFIDKTHTTGDQSSPVFLCARTTLQSRQMSPALRMNLTGNMSPLHPPRTR